MTNDNTKHTPGPWTYFARLSGSENHRGFAIAQVPRGWALADVMPVDEEGSQGRANAALIAAAPEMLEALRGVADYLAAVGRAAMGDLQSGTGISYNKLMAVIDKAEGCEVAP